MKVNYTCRIVTDEMCMNWLLPSNYCNSISNDPLRHTVDPCTVLCTS